MPSPAAMPDPLTAERPSSTILFRRWVLANAAGELVGLGGVGLVAATLVPSVQRLLPGSVAGPLATAALMIGLGAFEGAVVGTAQARALRGTGIEARAWIGATVLGAVLAWALGMLPSTIMALHGGPLLAAMQVRVLRRQVARPWRWLLANALGWAVGMPLVFAGVRNLVLHGTTLASVGGSAAALALAGAVVGAVEGVFLVLLLRPARIDPG